MTEVSPLSTLISGTTFAGSVGLILTGMQSKVVQTCIYILTYLDDRAFSVSAITPLVIDRRAIFKAAKKNCARNLRSRSLGPARYLGGSQ